MELEYWLSTFKTLTTESSLLTGFCFAGMRAAAGGEYPILNMFYLAVTACSMGFGTLCISTASLVSRIFLSFVSVLTSFCFLVDSIRNIEGFDGRAGLQVDGHCGGNDQAKVLPLLLLLHYLARLLLDLKLPSYVDSLQCSGCSDCKLRLRPVPLLLLNKRCRACRSVIHL